MHLLHHVVQSGNFPTDDHRNGIKQRLENHFAAWRFPYAGVPGAVGENHDIAREIRIMRAANIEQHTVVAGHRNDLHIGNHWAGLRIYHVRPTTGFNSTRLISPTSTR
ncbi:hypothetical protein D3C80_1594420 [compost metagenome]